MVAQPGSDISAQLNAQPTLPTAAGRLSDQAGTTPRSASEGVPPFPLTMPLLGHLPRFSGDIQDGGETFVEWFENIAKLVKWDAHWRLVHLTSNLRGTAAAFYRSCKVEVRSQYDSLVEALKIHACCCPNPTFSQSAAG